VIAELARAYGVDNVYDYDRPGKGLLLTSGSGGMLAAMDSMPFCRWAWVMEGMSVATPAHLAFMEAAAHVADVVVVFAFYGADLPSVGRDLVQCVVEPERLVVYANADLERGVRVHGWDQMVEQAEFVALARQKDVT